MQVLSKVCNICDEVVKDLAQLAKGDAHTIITGVVDKISDTKIQPHAYELLSSLSEVCSSPHSPYNNEYVLRAEHVFAQLCTVALRDL